MTVQVNKSSFLFYALPSYFMYGFGNFFCNSFAHYTQAWTFILALGPVATVLGLKCTQTRLITGGLQFDQGCGHMKLLGTRFEA